MDKNKEIIIDIPEEIVNFIQRLDIECQSYKNIISYILIHNDVNISNERFKQYQENYQKTLYAFEIAKQELEKKYVLNNFSNCSWRLDYKTNSLFIKGNDKI